MAASKSVRAERRETMRKRLIAGDSVDEISTDMSAAKSTIYAIKKELRQQVVPSGPDMMTYWVETIVYGPNQREVTRIACPLPSYKTGLEIALRSKGLKLP